MDNLQAIVTRLENVTAKLENFQGRISEGGGVAGAVGPSASQTGSSVQSEAAPAPGELDSVQAFQKLCEKEVVALQRLAEYIGKEGLIWPQEHRDEVVAISENVKKAFEAEKVVVDAISQCRRPSPTEMQKLVQPVGDQISEAGKRAQGKRTDLFNHYQVVAEAMQALSWVALNGGEEGRPSVFVDQCWQSAEFYANKILKEFKIKDPKHVDWVNGLKDLIKALKMYCSKYHLKEPSWKPTGISASEFMGSDPPADSTPPPPPEPEQEPAAPKKPAFPPAEAKDPGLPKVHPTKAWQPVDRPNPAHLAAGAFGEMKKGLRKVDDSEKTKNIPGRSGVVPAYKLKPKGAAAPSMKVGRTELEFERKWTVEEHRGNKEIVLENTNTKQTVYIYNCEDSVVKVEGKVNAITIDSCKKTGLVFESVLSSVEVINSKRTEMQCTGSIGTIVVDKCDGCQIYLPPDSLHAAVTTAKSSEVNITVTGEEHASFPVPEQFVSTFVDGKLVTKATEHAGA